MQIIVHKDGDGFLAKVVEADSLYAFGYTQQEALKELSNVVEMMSDTLLPLTSSEQEVNFSTV